MMTTRPISLQSKQIAVWCDDSGLLDSRVVRPVPGKRPLIGNLVDFTGRFNRLSTILPGSSFIFREMPTVTPGA